MTESQPVSFFQALRLMGWLSLRRQSNRWRSLRFGRKKDQAQRTGTAPKSGGRGIFGYFLLAILLFNGFNLASQGLVRLGEATANSYHDPGKILISHDTMKRLVEIEALKNPPEKFAPPNPLSYQQALDRNLKNIFQYQVRKEALTEEEEAQKIDQMETAFNQQGLSAFAVDASGGVYAGSKTWPREGPPAYTYQNTIGLLVLLFVPLFVCLCLGMNNKDLGQVEWSFEWLYGFPVSTRALLASRLFVYAIFNPPVWMFVCPFLVMVYFTGGCGLASIPLGLAATFYLSVLAGSITLMVEVASRKFLNLVQLKNLQAFFTVLGTIFLLLYLASLFSKPLEAYLISTAQQLPPTFAWNPLSFFLILGAPHSTSFQIGMVAAAMVIICLVVASSALFLSESLLREGLLKSAGPYQGNRKATATPPHQGLLKGIVANEMLLLRRDRNLLVQVLVTPFIVVAYYFLVNSNMIKSATGNFHHAATMAFVIGSYVLLSSAMQILTRENKTLWQLMTFPKELSSILLEKTWVWAVFAVTYSGIILAILAFFNRHLHASAFLDASLALYGAGLYAFIAAGIGVLGTNPLDDEPQTRMRPDIIYLFMILVGMYAFAIYTPSLWAKFAQVTLSTLLAYALWQKVKDITPYFLDPEEKPKRSLSLADGMMAALAFFVLQGLTGFVLTDFRSMPLAMQVVLAYVIAGFLVFVLSLTIFSSQKIPRLWESIGLFRSPENQTSLLKACATGLAYGLVAALGALAYMHILDMVPEWHLWKEDSQMSALLRRADNPLWLCLLAVIAAPLFEEFIFRGLVFQGLRRSTGVFWAVIASAALFAIVHPPLSVIPVFGLGIATALSFQRTGFLLAPILAHATYNAFVVFWFR